MRYLLLTLLLSCTPLLRGPSIASDEAPVRVCITLPQGEAQEAWRAVRSWDTPTVWVLRDCAVAIVRAPAPRPDVLGFSHREVLHVTVGVVWGDVYEIVRHEWGHVLGLPDSAGVMASHALH